MIYARHTFRTYRLKDPVPVKAMIEAKMPFWVTGYYTPINGKIKGMYVMCYLPSDAKLRDYWDDAEEVSTIIGFDHIEYSEKYPRPLYLHNDDDDNDNSESDEA